MTVYTSSGSLTLASNVKRVRYYAIGGGGGGAIPYVEKSPGPPRTWTLYNGTNPAGGSTSSGPGEQTSIRANGITVLTANGGGGGGASSGGSGGSGNFSTGANGALAQTCGSPSATPGSSPAGSPLSNVYGRGGAGASACSSCSGNCAGFPSTFGGGGGGSSFREVNRGTLGANPGNVITWTVGTGGFQGGFGSQRFGGSGAVGIVIETYNIPAGSITANNSNTNITIVKGNSVAIRWNVNSDADTINIPQASVSTTAKTGITTLTPTSTTTYQLRLSNPAFNDVLADSITVTVIDPPVFFLNASATERINLPTDSVTLNWGLTSGTANRVVWTSTFNGDIVSPSAVTSNTTVRPGVTTTYTAFAEDTVNNVKSPSISRTITVFQPASATLNVPQSVNYGQQFNIECVVANATRGATLSVSYTYANNQTVAGTTINVSNGTNNITSSVPYNNNGPLQINYTLSVLGGSITRPSNASVSKPVNVVIPPPTITSFTASPQNILSGKKSKLTWNVTGVAFDTISISSIGSSLAKIGNQEVSPSSTTTYTLTATNLSGTRTATAQVNVFQPPKVTLSFSKNPIVRGESTTLSWSTTGNATSAFLSPIIGSTLLSSNTPVNPVTDSTYTITVRLLVPPDIDVTDSDTKTLIVFQPPTVNIAGPEKINYSEQTVLSYAATNSVTSLTITPIYTYRNETITGAPVTLQPGVDVSGEYNTGIPYTTMGPFHVQYIIRAVGFGNPGSELTASDAIEIPIDIDETPENFIIPESRDKIKNEEPVISPDSAATSFQIQINDIDIPVEIKSNRPIEVRFDDEDTWNKIRPI